MDRRAFDAAFGPFWRTEMFIIRPAKRVDRRVTQGEGVHGEEQLSAASIVAPEVLQSVMQLQLTVRCPNATSCVFGAAHAARWFVCGGGSAETVELDACLY